MKKVAVITGASAGIGAAMANTFLQAGYCVYAAARRLELMQPLEQRGARIVQLDLTESASIAALAESVRKGSGRIDVLINNAGYGAYGAMEEIPIEEARRQMEVNLMGPADLIRKFLPMMRKQRSGRILNVTSIGGKTWSPYGSWYQASKFAFEGFSDCLRNELRPFGIEVVVIEPGAIASEWTDITIQNIKATSSRGPYKTLTEAVVKFFEGVNKRGAPASLVADAALRAATSKRPHTRYVVPKQAAKLIELRRTLSDRAFDRVMQKLANLPDRL